MDLDEYIWLSRTTNKKISEITGTAANLISRYKSRSKTPNLLTALKLFYATQGKVSFENMLSQKDKKKWDRFLETLGGKKNE